MKQEKRSYHAPLIKTVEVKERVALACPTGVDIQCASGFQWCVETTSCILCSEECIAP